MSRIRAYERVLDALIAEALVRRPIGAGTGARRDTGKSRAARLWINGHEFCERNSRFAHLGQSHD